MDNAKILNFSGNKVPTVGRVKPFDISSQKDIGDWRYFKQGQWYCKHNIHVFPAVTVDNLFRVGDTYQGFGKIIAKLDSTHLLSYNEETNCAFTLTCRNFVKPLPNSVLDAYSFWKKTDIEQTIIDAGFSASANRRNALIINADEWLLGMWGVYGGFIECNETSARMLQEYDIDVFMLNNRQQVTNAFYMNPKQAKTRILDCENGIMIKERPIFNPENEVAMLEQIFIYTDGAPCTLECPLAEMHVTAECKCKMGTPINYDKWVAEKWQLELFEQETKRMINCCLSPEGLIVYKCGYAKINLSLSECGGEDDYDE